jgi:hypothetical protein
VSGPFVATADIGAPFKIMSEPYTIEGPAVEPQIVHRRTVWVAVVVLAIVATFVIAFILRGKKLQ